MRETNLRSSSSDKAIDFSLRDVLAPLMRRRRLILLSFLGIFALMAVVILSKGNSYESRMSILVSREREDPLVTSLATNQMMGAVPALTDEEVNSESELLQSSDVLNKVVLANGLQKSQGKSIFDLLHPGETDEDRAARATRGLARKLKIETPTKTNLIEVSYSASNPQRAYGVLKSLSDFYLDKHAAVHRPQGSYDFFASEAARYKQALDLSEARLRELGEKENVADPDEERTALAQQLATNIGQFHNTEQAIAADQQRMLSDEEQLRSTPERSATKQETNASEVLLQQLGTAQLAAETKRTQLLAKYQPDYPLVREADQELAGVKAAIAAAEKTHYINDETDRDPTFELLREDLTKTRSDLAAQRASLIANQHSIDAMQHQMVQLGGQSLKLADLQRDAKDSEQNYLLYLSKREQARTSDALDRNRIENVAIAVPPAIPVLPVHGVLFYMAMAFAMAVVLSVGLGYLMDFLDPSFHSPGQAAELLGVPVIAINRRTA